MDEGRFTIPTRIYLTAAERAKLGQLLRRQGRELDELLSELVVARLAAEPDPPAEESPHDARAEELRQRRATLRSLRPKLNDPHNPPPPWLTQMVAELEAEIRRLERAEGQ